MRFIYFKEIDSTQKYLMENYKNYSLPVCVWSECQTNGIGSRGNKWIGKCGNLFFSFADYIENYKNIPLQSLSIYFGWIIKEVLNEFGSKAVLKWPNDIYLERKIGGVITNIKSNVLICGIGINTKFAVDGFDSLDIDVKNDKILKRFFEKVNKKNFSDIIKSYKIEFEKTKKRFMIEGTLLEDGAILKKNEKVYSRR
jgi:BirA family biotin operon repressor/biotin-[acetyl-CoA-carboxylase] ligase